VLNRAQRWKAILLIDEADVYVHERGNDIQQNAIVGVFLRVLEYYRGILFMTSNRETVIDDAIMSRATAWIRYDLPDRERAVAIWRVLSNQYKAGLKDVDFAKLVEMDKFKAISGRSIKNLLKLAKLMAARKKQPVTVQSIDYVSQFLDLECSKPD
jgi:SpoVK/Ycf46/Vps4 family AAA+-type ATPase